MDQSDQIPRGKGHGGLGAQLLLEEHFCRVPTGTYVRGQGQEDAVAK